jgi:hypothetical protein
VLIYFKREYVITCPPKLEAPIGDARLDPYKTRLEKRQPIPEFPVQTKKRGYPSCQ